MKNKRKPTPPPLHEQLGVSADVVRGEQALLNVITMANEMGTSADFTRREHKKILEMLKTKGVLDEK